VTIDELEKMIKRAEDVLGCKIRLMRDYDGDYSLRKHSVLDDAPLYTTFDKCISTLKKWATPPKPDMLAVMVPIATAEFTAEFQSTGCSAGAQHARVLSSLFREALKPYQPEGV